MSEQDTREKLDGDLNATCWEWFSEFELSYEQADSIKKAVYKMLDRQAAITTAYCTSEDEGFCEACRAAQKRKIAELTAERNELQKVVHIQAESFRKLEQELKEAKDAIRGSHDDDKPGDEKAKG